MIDGTAITSQFEGYSYISYFSPN